MAGFCGLRHDKCDLETLAGATIRVAREVSPKDSGFLRDYGSVNLRLDKVLMRCRLVLTPN